jgi:hypothetical protein
LEWHTQHHKNPIHRAKTYSVESDFPLWQANSSSQQKFCFGAIETGLACLAGLWFLDNGLVGSPCGRGSRLRISGHQSASPLTELKHGVLYSRLDWFYDSEVHRSHVGQCKIKTKIANHQLGTALDFNMI